MNYLKKLQEFTSSIQWKPDLSMFHIPEASQVDLIQTVNSHTQHVCICIDVSSSMNGVDFRPTRLEAVKQAASEFISAVAHTSPSTAISIIKFSQQASLVHPAALARESQHSLKQAVLTMKAWGSTNMCAALHLSKNQFQLNFNPSASKRILLLTDGDHNCWGNPINDSARLKQQGIQLDIVGIGTGRHFNESTLKTMASVVDGKLRYWFITSTEGLVERFQTLAVR